MVGSGPVMEMTTIRSVRGSPPLDVRESGSAGVRERRRAGGLELKRSERPNRRDTFASPPLPDFPTSRLPNFILFLAMRAIMRAAAGQADLDQFASAATAGLAVP